MDDSPTSHRRVRSRMEPDEVSGVPPRLWAELPVEVRRQLAQRVGQLLQRLRPLTVTLKEGDCVDNKVVER